MQLKITALYECNKKKRKAFFDVGKFSFIKEVSSFSALSQSERFIYFHDSCDSYVILCSRNIYVLLIFVPAHVILTCD